MRCGGLKECSLACEKNHSALTPHLTLPHLHTSPSHTSTPHPPTPPHLTLPHLHTSPSRTSTPDHSPHSLPTPTHTHTHALTLVHALLAWCVRCGGLKECSLACEKNHSALTPHLTLPHLHTSPSHTSTPHPPTPPHLTLPHLHTSPSRTSTPDHSPHSLPTPSPSPPTYRSVPGAAADDPLWCGLPPLRAVR